MEIPLQYLITPTHKPGAAATVNYQPITKPIIIVNYQPISLTNILCRILENIVFRNLLAKVTLNNRLHSRHHGFGRELFCETNLCAMLNNFLGFVDSHNSVYATVLDFSKAFIRVPCTLLMEKLSMVEEICDYLPE